MLDSQQPRPGLQRRLLEPPCTSEVPLGAKRRGEVLHRPEGVRVLDSGFEPAGRYTEFQSVIATPFPSDQDVLVALSLLDLVYWAGMNSRDTLSKSV